MILHAVCAPGLEGVLAAELEALGLRAEHEAPGLLSFEGGLLEGARACLLLRAATTVRAQLVDTEVRAQRAIDAALGAAGLEAHLPPAASVSLHTSLQRSWLRHSGVLEEKARAALSGRAFSSEGLGVLVRLEGRRLTVAVDLAGESLHKRGWRREGGRAPLRETLACGLLALAGWAPGTPLFDPMCGSGTIPIEAARWALGIAPGEGRPFAVEATPAFEEHREVFAFLRETMRADHQIEGPSGTLCAGDTHRGAVASTRRNATRAGVADALVVTHGTLPSMDPPDSPPGLVICNAPYGRRVGADRQEVLASHRALGEAMRGPLKGWRLALLTRDRSLAEATGLDLEHVASLHNGGLPVTFFKS